MKPTDPVTAAFAAYKAAVLAKDADAFCALYDADIHVFDMWGQWQHQGLAAWRRMAEGWFGSVGEERVVVEFSDIRAEQAGELAFGHAIARFSAQAADGTPLRSLDNRFTVVLRRQADGWKIIHEHTSAPIEHSTCKAMLNR
jgi:uncharacterized protein (TIGR02246 family)